MATDPSEVFDLLARGINVTRAPKKLPSHYEDIARMQDAGFPVASDPACDYIEVHVAAFKVLGRGDFDTISGATDPEGANCRAYPTPDGGWIISRYGIRAEQEKPGWKNNDYGYACFRMTGLRPVIDVGRMSEKEIADATAQALVGAKIYQRAGLLCQVRPGNPLPPHVLRRPDAPIITPLPKSAVREAISEVTIFKRFDAKKKKLVPTTQPSWLTQNIFERGNYPVPTIEAVSTVPLFLADGSILTKPGYDANSGVYYAPDTDFGDLVSVEEAKATLDDVLSDFPFAKPAHKSAAYAGFLTLLARRAFIGKSPMFLIEANRPGAGKGLLADVLGVIGTGAPFARMTAPGCEDEMRKQLTSISLAGEPAVLLDNLSGKLRSAVLDAALTSDTWTDRLLGRNEQIKVPMATIFLATGNNLALHADTVRRVCHIRLDTPLEHPEQRTDCKYPELLSHVRTHRDTLTMAALSILHHYHKAKRPDQNLKPWGSFEGWGLIRNVIVWAGMPDPAETLADLRAANDEDSGILRLLLDGWVEAGGCLTAKEAIEKSSELAEDGFRFPTLHAAIDEIDGRDKKQALGLVLRKYMGCRLDGRHFERDEGRVTKWTVKS